MYFPIFTLSCSHTFFLCHFYSPFPPPNHVCVFTHTHTYIFFLKKWRTWSIINTVCMHADILDLHFFIAHLNDSMLFAMSHFAIYLCVCLFMLLIFFFLYTSYNDVISDIINSKSSKQSNSSSSSKYMLKSEIMSRKFNAHSFYVNMMDIQYTYVFIRIYFLFS